MQNLTYPSEKEASLLNFEEPQDFNSQTQVARTVDEPGLEPSRSGAEVDDKVRRAEEALAALQEKREKLEREKQELEELSARRQAFRESREQVVNTLTSALPELSEECFIGELGLML